MSVNTASPADVLVERLRREWVPFLSEKLVLMDHATPGTLDRNVGSKTLRWLEFNKITQDETGGLTEASATDGEVAALSITTYTTTVGEYGAWAKLSSLVELAHTPQTRQAYIKGFSEHGARTMDSLVRDAISTATGFTTTFLVSGETAKNTGTLATAETAIANDVAIITKIFRGNDAEPFTKLGGHYVCVVHSEVESDIVTDMTTTHLNWQEINKYVHGIDGQKKIVQGSPGAVYGTMIQVSNNITTATLTTGIVAYANLALAVDGVGVASFSGMTPKNSGGGAKGPRIIIKSSGSQDTSNPLSMFNTIGWKAALGQKALGNNRAIVYYSSQAG